MQEIKLSAAERVHQAIADLTAASQPATRRSISIETGLTLQIVDWHIKQFRDQGRLQRSGRADGAIGRSCRLTMLPQGRCELEIGDMCHNLSLREGRAVAMATAGIALVFGK